MNNVWSRYNYLFNSNKYGKFLYNARTNSFFKLSDSLFTFLGNNNRDISNQPEILTQKLEEIKAIVGEFEDDNYFYQKKCASYAQAFAKEILSLTIATTTHCNFRCPYCYEEGAEKSTMKRDVEDAIIKLIEDNPAKSALITWYGGEPLLNFKTIKHIMEILKNEYKKKKINYSMVTNGYLLDKRKVNFLKQFEVDSIQITLDGLKDTNDKTRILKNGAGSFDKIIENLRYAVINMPKCQFAIRVNIDKKNIKEYPQLHEFLKSEFKEISNLYIYHQFIVDYTGKTPECIGNKEDYLYNSSLLRDHNINDFKLYPSFSTGGCIANGINGFVIDPNGNTCRCWVEIGKQDKITGTIMENNNIKPNPTLISKYMVTGDMYENKKCRDCFFFPNCGGGCPYQRINYGQKKACPYTKKQIEAYLELQYELSLKNK